MIHKVEYIAILLFSILILTACSIGTSAGGIPVRAPSNNSENMPVDENIVESDEDVGLNNLIEGSDDTDQRVNDNEEVFDYDAEIDNSDQDNSSDDLDSESHQDEENLTGDFSSIRYTSDAVLLKDSMQELLNSLSQVGIEETRLIIRGRNYSISEATWEFFETTEGIFQNVGTPTLIFMGMQDDIYSYFADVPVTFQYFDEDIGEYTRQSNFAVKFSSNPDSTIRNMSVYSTGNSIYFVPDNGGESVGGESASEETINDPEFITPGFDENDTIAS